MMNHWYLIQKLVEPNEYLNQKNKQLHNHKCMPKQEMDPIMQLIQNAHKIKPATLEMSDIKWKYLVRSAVRGKNIMMVGPAGCGKTQAAKDLA
jgi:predicted ATPase with chaperone activity